MNVESKKILSDPLFEELATASLGQLRTLREACDGAERDISFVRRLTQGRLDIVGHEVSRRSDSGEAGEAAVSEILFDLPEILSDQLTAPVRNNSNVRRVTVEEPGPVAVSLLEELDLLVSPNTLSAVEGLEQPVLMEVFDALKNFETSLSGSRREFHVRIDSIQAEITRRYKEGEVSVESVLNGE